MDCSGRTPLVYDHAMDLKALRKVQETIRDQNRGTPDWRTALYRRPLRFLFVGLCVVTTFVVIKALVELFLP